MMDMGEWAETHTEGANCSSSRVDKWNSQVTGPYPDRTLESLIRRRRSKPF